MITKLDEMKLSARDSESVVDSDSMDFLFETPTKLDQQKSVDDVSYSKAKKSFFGCSVQHITNPETFLSDLQKECEGSDAQLQNKRRRLCTNTEDPINPENALEDLIEKLNPAHKRYILYKPGKMTPDNRHISYSWLLSICSMFIECPCQDIDDCINRIQYFLPKFHILGMVRAFKVTRFPQGLVPCF
jgi:hypothetical protein